MANGVWQVQFAVVHIELHWLSQHHRAQGWITSRYDELVSFGQNLIRPVVPRGKVSALDFTGSLRLDFWDHGQIVAQACLKRYLADWSRVTYRLPVSAAFCRSTAPF
jgi:hypothetical protein